MTPLGAYRAAAVVALIANRLTENKKRSHAALAAAYRCPDCITEIEDPSGYRPVIPIVFCAEHGCSGITKRGSRCQNAATYSEVGICGIHLGGGGL